MKWAFIFSLLTSAFEYFGIQESPHSSDRQAFLNRDPHRAIFNNNCSDFTTPIAKVDTSTSSVQAEKADISIKTSDLSLAHQLLFI
jgi:hypothetical protein